MREKAKPLNYWFYNYCCWPYAAFVVLCY